MIKKVRGFTLIEIIIGIVVLSIALTGGLSLLISQVDAYRDPLIKEKSVQIAKRVVHEIQIRAYDEKSDIGGGIFRCSETVGGISLGDCSAEAEYGTDPGELMLDTLDDVDDFDTANCVRNYPEATAVQKIIFRWCISSQMLLMRLPRKNTMTIMPAFL